jgi:hypothetical protein
MHMFEHCGFRESEISIIEDKPIKKTNSGKKTTLYAFAFKGDVNIYLY